MRWRLAVLLALCLASSASLSARATAPPDSSAGHGHLTAAELGVVVNDGDALSQAIADYYVRARAIPAANVIHVRFDAPHVQAYALTWVRPYRVDCMSITTSFGGDLTGSRQTSSLRWLETGEPLARPSGG